MNSRIVRLSLIAALACATTAAPAENPFTLLIAQAGLCFAGLPLLVS